MRALVPSIGHRRRARGAIGAIALLMATAVVAPLAGAVARPNITKAGVTCAPGAVTTTVSTNQSQYGPGQLVVMTVSAHNSSKIACDLTVGPTSPSFTVTNASGEVVWNNCYADDEVGACPMFLMLHHLAAGATYTKTATWNQLRGLSGSRVPAGVYRLRVHWSGLRGGVATFELVGAGPAPLVATRTDNGHSYTLEVGDSLEVQLVGAPYGWSTPTSSNVGVLELVAGSPGVATFSALVAGSARVTALGRPTCAPACLTPELLYAITVTVVG